MALKPKHIKALDLLEENILSTEEVAKACNMSHARLRDLMYGYADDPVTAEFFTEYQRRAAKIYRRVDAGTKAMCDRLLKKFETWLDKTSLNPNARTFNKNLKAGIDLFNALNKTQVTIFNTLNEDLGLNDQELVQEYRRLRGVVNTLVRGGIHATPESGKAGVLEGLEGGSEDAEIEEAPLLHAPQETGTVSQKQGPPKSRFRRKPQREDDLRSS